MPKIQGSGNINQNQHKTTSSKKLTGKLVERSSSEKIVTQESSKKEEISIKPELKINESKNNGLKKDPEKLKQIFKFLPTDLGFKTKFASILKIGSSKENPNEIVINPDQQMSNEMISSEKSSNENVTIKKSNNAHKKISHESKQMLNSESEVSSNNNSKQILNNIISEGNLQIPLNNEQAKELEEMILREKLEIMLSDSGLSRDEKEIIKDILVDKLHNPNINNKKDKYTIRQFIFGDYMTEFKNEPSTENFNFMREIKKNL